VSLDLMPIEPIAVQMSFDYSEYSPELAASLERHATNMEGFTKRYAAGMGKELAEAKAEIHAEKQTGWAKWVEGRLGITVSWADIIIKRFREEKSPTKLEIPSSMPPAPQQLFSDNAPDLGGDMPATKEQRDNHVMRVMGSSESPEWYTPQEIIRLVVTFLGGVDLDPCSNSHETPNVPARTLYTKDDDGLAHTWLGKVYLNPPYGSEIGLWTSKLVNSYPHEVEEAIALLPGRIDTAWFQPLYAHPMCNIRGRLQFENAQYSAPFPSVIVYLGERLDAFIQHFGDLGPIMRRIDDKRV